MLESIQFTNFKALRDATLPLSRLTVIVGPNGAGKSTIWQGIKRVWQGIERGRPDFLAVKNVPEDVRYLRTADASPSAGIGVRLNWGTPPRAFVEWNWTPDNRSRLRFPDAGVPNALQSFLDQAQGFSLDADAIARPASMSMQYRLQPDGGQLPRFLDELRDKHPERFELLNQQLHEWLPEFDRVLFDTPGDGMRGIMLRTSQGHHAIPASELSHGTLLALALLGLAYGPDPLALVFLEEPDRGLHPRLLRNVVDALRRLAYPEEHGEQRPATQVIATTHSPYLLDLFRDRPEEIVIAEKIGLEARFQKLVDRPDIDVILQDSHLGDAWYTGVLGGVPTVPSP